MGTWHSKDINPQVLMIAALTACLIIHIPSTMHPGQPNGITGSEGNQPQHISLIAQNSNIFYLTDNVTVAAGGNYTISGENLILESLSQSSMNIEVWGNLYIVNSTLSLSGASYSSLKNFSIYLNPGSTFTVSRSNLTFPGVMVFNNSRIKIENSTLNTSISEQDNPYDSSLRISANASDVSISNSSINGLYRQKGSFEYTDGFQYLYNTSYSYTNTTIPMVHGYGKKPSSIINTVNVKITYNSLFNESNSYLKVAYEGSFIDDFLLSYNLSDNYLTRTFSIKLSGVERSLQWMETSSNFYLYLVTSSNEPITLYNVSEYFLSNDTVSLYGNSLFSYNFTDSNITIFNSALGLNNSVDRLVNGQWDPFKNFMSLWNSHLVMGDTSLISPGQYRSPFFTNYNSTVTLFRSIAVTAYSHNIPVQEFHYNISDQGNGSSNNFLFYGVLNSTGDHWLSTWKYNPVIYDTQADADSWNYTDTFIIVSGNSRSSFSVPPFPTLNKGILNITFNDPNIPYASFSIQRINITENGTGSFYLGWKGNTSSLQNIGINWSMYDNNSNLADGNMILPEPQNNSTVRINVTSGTHLEAGHYSLYVHETTTQEHAFGNSGNSSQSFSVYNSSRPVYRVSITGTDNINGEIWGITVGNQTIYTNGTTIDTDITGNATARIVAPEGFYASPGTLLLTPSVGQYSVSFSRIQFDVAFDNSGIAKGVQWKLLIAGKEYSSSNSSIQVKLQPGSYNYEVMEPKSYSTVNKTGIIQVIDTSFSVHIQSQKILSWTAMVINHVETPGYYIPITILTVIAISLLGWDSSHTWYVCKNCGSTRKSKRKACPYCGK